MQVWITLIGILTGYFGGESIALALRDELAQLPWIARHAGPVSVGVSVGLILFVSVVVGELVPKRLAIVRPEKVATAVALPMRVLAIAAAPAVTLLSATTEMLFKLFPVRHGNDSDVTEEEIKMLVAESHEQGVIDVDERNMVNRVLNLGDRTVDSLMTPRTRIAWLDAAASLDENLAVLRESRHSRYPVYRGSDQDVLGVVETKMMVAELASGKTPELFRELQAPLFVPEAAKAMQLLDQMRESEAALAFVVDEYGDIQGLVTMGDLMGAVFGRLAHAIEANEQPIVQRADGSWLIDGSLPVQDLRELLGLGDLPHEQDQEYRTLAGMFMAQFGRIPGVGEHFEFGGFRFEVIDLDGARIDKVLVVALAAPAEHG